MTASIVAQSVSSLASRSPRPETAVSLARFIAAMDRPVRWPIASISRAEAKG